MSFIKYRVRVLEPFKDGMILEGRELKPEQVIDLDESDFQKIVNSGGMLEVIDTLVPNPLRAVKEVPPMPNEPKPVAPEELPEILEERPEPPAKKPGLVRGRRAKK